MVKKVKYHGIVIFSHNDADLIFKILENVGFLVYRFAIDSCVDAISIYEEIPIKCHFHKEGQK